MSETKQDDTMSPNKPYLIRAFYEWIVDNECTPYALVDASIEGVKVPPQFVEDGRIILNVGPMAVKNLIIDNEAMQFSARFSSQIMHIYVPVFAILAIYARENGRGMVFSEEDNFPPPSSPDGDGGNDSGETGKGKPNLRIIK